MGRRGWPLKSAPYPLLAGVQVQKNILAGAAELVMGKLSGVPVAIIQGYEYPKGHGAARDMIRPPERDLFR